MNIKVKTEEYVIKFKSEYTNSSIIYIFRLYSENPIFPTKYDKACCLDIVMNYGNGNSFELYGLVDVIVY